MSKKNQRFQDDRNDAFTLVEIMIVVAVIGILAVIAVPNYLKSGRKAQRKACVANLSLLAGAIEQCRLDGSAGTITMDMLCEPDGHIKGEPRCPYEKSQPYDISGVLPVCPNVGAPDCSEHVCPEGDKITNYEFEECESERF